MLFLRKSKWEYSTGANVSLGSEAIVGSGGTITLNDPTNQPQEFSYAGFGVGFSLPIPKLNLPPLTILNREVSGTAAAESFPGEGTVFMTNAFHGIELSRSDIQGATLYLDWSYGLLVSSGWSVMLLGINPALLIPAVVSPGLGSNLAAHAITHAPAVLVMHGYSEGLIAGTGLGLSVGYMH